MKNNIFLLTVIASLQLQLPDAFCLVRNPTTNKGSLAVSVRNDNENNIDISIPSNQTNSSSHQPIQLPTPTDPFQATGSDELFRTLAGGPALIFEMARKSILFVKDSDAKALTTNTKQVTDKTSSSSSLPQRRWYPHSGISDVNPSFRTQSPAMNNQGFAKSIWRNVRKRNKPSLWKHALRTYDRMTMLEGEPSFEQIQRSNIHHEGAMQACAKLGLWQRALEIYHYVYQQEIREEEAMKELPSLHQRQQPSSSLKNGRRSSSSNSNERNTKKITSVYVTDNMVLSLVRAAVRASRLRSRRKKSHEPPLSPEQEEREAALRKIPLDTALEILSTLPDDHGLPPVAYYFNPLAAAYQRLGYTAFSKEILQTMLSNRTAGEDEILNVNDLCAKDKGSYSLLVQASVVTGDWGSAVDSLSEMTNAGLYPDPVSSSIYYYYLLLLQIFISSSNPELSSYSIPTYF